MNRKDWLKALGVVGLGLTGAGMFGAGPLAAMLGGGEAAAGAGAAAGEGLGASGMFAQIPGVANGSAQAQALAAQTAEFGGAGADLTAKAAMNGVNAARDSGQMGLMDFIANKGKADLAGLNDPSVLMQRASTNLGRMAGNAAKGMGTNALMQSMAPQGGPGPMPAAPRPNTPAPSSPQRYGPTPPAPGMTRGGSEEQDLIRRAMMGDQQAAAELKRRGIG